MNNEKNVISSIINQNCLSLCVHLKGEVPLKIMPLDDIIQETMYNSITDFINNIYIGNTDKNLEENDKVFVDWCNFTEMPDQSQGIVCQIQCTDEYLPFDFLSNWSNNLLEFSQNDDAEKLIGYIFRYSCQEGVVWAYQNIYTSPAITLKSKNKKGTFKLVKKGYSFKAFNDIIFEIKPSVDLIVYNTKINNK